MGLYSHPKIAKIVIFGNETLSPYCRTWEALGSLTFLFSDLAYIDMKHHEN